MVVGQNGPFIAVSPDGTQLAFVVSTINRISTQLWVRRIDATEASPLPGTDGAANPFWSPDGRSIAFFAGTQLKKIDISGGSPQILCANPAGVPAAGLSVGTWSPEGTIVFNATGSQVLHRVAASGGTPTPTTVLDESRAETGHYWARFLPDGRHFLYWANSTTPEHRGIRLGLLDSTETRPIVESEFAADFARPNYLLFRRGSTLFAQTLNLQSFQLEGEAARIADPVGALTGLGRPGFTVSDTGVLVFWPFASIDSGDAELGIHDRTGKTLASLGVSAYRGIALSPDGTRLATHIHDAAQGGDVWLLDLQRGTRQRFTFDASQDNSSPVWSSDGSRIAFASLRAGRWGLYQKPSSGTGPEELLFESSTPKAPSGYSPDGKSLLFENVDPKTGQDLWVLPLAGDRKLVPYLQSPFRERSGQISPDGRWVAYGSNESGRSEIYVQGYSTSSGKWQVSTGGGSEPRWRRDGKELFFVFNNPSQIFAITVEPDGDGLRFGIPEVLFPALYRFPNHATPYYVADVSADGQRFFIPRTPATSDTARLPLTVVLNWTSALQQN